MISIHDIAREKARIIKEIQDIVRPHLHESGYLKGGLKSEHIQLYHFGYKDVDGDQETICLPLGNSDFQGYTEDGIIDDVYIGMSELDYRSMYLEQLIELLGITKGVKFIS